MAEWTVGNDGQFLTFEEAVNAAADGDTIILLERVDYASCTITKNLTVDIGGLDLIGDIKVAEGVELSVKNGYMEVYDTANIVVGYNAMV